MGITVNNMRAEGWMSIWELKEGTPMNMEKKRMKI
jgi:hypothetical protein